MWGKRREGGGGGANGLGGGQSGIIAPPTGSGVGRDGDRRDEASEKKGWRTGRERERGREGWWEGRGREGGLKTGRVVEGGGG